MLICMHVTAFSSPGDPEWRWRITDSAGEVIEESGNGFASISAAVAVGKQRLKSLNIVDRAPPPLRPWGRRSQRKGGPV
jgi:hypothetical protein